MRSSFLFRKDINMPYEVQIYTCHRTWKNACAYDEGDGLRDETFATRDAAQDALDELLADIIADRAEGLAAPWCLDHFRVAYVPDCNAISHEHLKQEGAR